MRHDFLKKYPVRILVLGVGGTGGHVVPNLYRLAYSLKDKRPVDIILADGDTVEKKNLLRQNFVEADLDKKKAAVLAYRYSSAFGVPVNYIPDFIESDEKLAKLLKPSQENEISILLGCVDNNRSRQMCHRVFQTLDNLVYIDSGNGEYTGQVVCGVRKKGRTKLNPVCHFYPEMLTDSDKFKSEESCSDAIVSSPQNIMANIMAATIILSYLNGILALGRLDTHRVTFSSRSIHVKPAFIKK
jgi:PRTRC genetic system ThiF family protein